MVFTATLDPWSFLKTEAVPLTVITAILGVIFAVLNLMKLASDSRERTRPYIALEPRLGVHLDGAIDLVVTNYGQSPAHNVVLKPLGKLEAGKDEYILPLLDKVFNRSFYLAPHASFRIMWRTIEAGSECGAPEVLDVEVTYSWSKPTLLWRNRDYTEVITVDTGFTAAAPMPATGPIRKLGSPSEKSLANINNAIRTLSQHVANRY
ncbi:MAG TPA: hypothetical protein H9821_02845 [Candidatus Rothia avicola]|uniref:Uncharacterized protein n=1 Tax=Candidatus Rothia avicola TaxID=2840478 RepID=A0A9D2CQI6_9MICC|nr:hypothetical protein [Candidatus Rothia avicola]